MSASTLLALCLFAFGSIGLVSATSELKVGEPAPDFTLKALNGKTMNTETLIMDAAPPPIEVLAPR
jgi:hypothetical protein